MDIILHHESKDWKSKIEELSVELSALFDERDYLKNVLLPNIEREYLCELGELELRKFILMVEIKKTKYMTELIQAYINRRELPDFDIIHHTIFEEFKAWEFEMGERAASIDRARNESKMARFATHEETIKCRKLFREIVKKLHPDVIGEHTEAQKILWMQAQHAYTICNIDELRSIALIINTSKEHVWEQTESEYKDKIESLKHAISHLQKEIVELRCSSQYLRQALLMDKAKVLEMQEILTKEITDGNIQLQYLSILLDALYKDWKPE